MNFQKLNKKIYGCLAGIAVGDALGFPVHDMAGSEIESRFNGLLARMEAPWDDEPIHKNYKACQVTDDTLLTIVTAEAIIAENGVLDSSKMATYLADWAEKNPNIWEGDYSGFGPSTKNSFRNMIKNKGKSWEVDKSRGRMQTGATNGAVMRIAPTGLAFPGNCDRAINLAAEVVLPTHSTQVAVAAACAQAAGISEALKENADISSIIDAMIYGAREGERIGRRSARIVPAPNIQTRLELVKEKIHGDIDPYEAGKIITAYIGTGLHVAETLPATAGFFIAANGDPRTAILAAINTGGDTDTNASISGGLCGAYKGIDLIPNEWLRSVEKQNNLELEKLAERLTKVAISNL